MRDEIYTQKEIDFIKKHYKDMTVSEIAKRLNRSKYGIVYKLKDLNLQKSKTQKWTNEELDFLRENYKTMSYKDIGNNLNRTCSAVQNKCKKMGLKKPDKYFYNHRFFQFIDTEEKAYWLGFIYADGWVRKTNAGAELGISLQSGDVKHLLKFNRSINGNISIVDRTRPFCIEGRTGVSTCSTIRLYSTDMVNDLIRHGVVPNKSDKIQFPYLSSKFLMLAFIRGFFDGDGCIMEQTKRKAITCNFTTISKNFIEDLRKWLYENIGVSSYIVQEKRHNDKNKTCYRLYIKGLENSYIFTSSIYDNANIYLNRKYNLYHKILKKYDIINRIQCHNNTNRVTHSDCLSNQ